MQPSDLRRGTHSCAHFPSAEISQFFCFALCTNDFLFQAYREILPTCTQITLFHCVFLLLQERFLETIVSMLLSAQDY